MSPGPIGMCVQRKCLRWHVHVWSTVLINERTFVFDCHTAGHLLFRNSTYVSQLLRILLIYRCLDSMVCPGQLDCAKILLS